jgi:hypothetical protein
MSIRAGKKFDQEVLEERARNLDARNLNGIARVFVRLLPAIAPTETWLDLEFHTTHVLAAILAEIGGGTAAHAIFPITGGTRLRAGPSPGQVRVNQVLAGLVPNQLRLRVTPIGDYSTYTLSINPFGGINPLGIDPLLSEIDFKFRPACFNLDCAANESFPAPMPVPDIDYLAKDFDSFKHTLITAMQQRVPHWQPTSEADLDQVLIDLIAADADELSDFQDRTLNEAFLATARKRVSLARHARLMDYHIHQGNQASSWLALKVQTPFTVSARTGFWTNENWQDKTSQPFITSSDVSCNQLLNSLQLYTWGGSVTALDAGSTSADIALPSSLNPAVKANAESLRDLLNNIDPIKGPQPKYFLIQQHLNPETGTALGLDPSARQLLLLKNNAEAVFDPMGGMLGEWFVRVHWREEDRLTRRYCFCTQCDTLSVKEDVSLFHGNLAQITHGRPHRTIFRAAGSPLAVGTPDNFLYVDEAHFETTPWAAQSAFPFPICALAKLPHAPLAYLETEVGGVTPVRSTLKVSVAGFVAPWQEQSDLIESKDDAPHFIVETDEYLDSRLRFGNGRNARELAPDAVITCDYQVSVGIDGNVGADTVTGYDTGAMPLVSAAWNPFDIRNGREPEPVAEIIRRVPEAYRARQLRAVTLEDYARRAEELTAVAHAHASYAWTGSWRTVRVAIDPRGSNILAEPLRQKIAEHLDAVRLIGEDLEVRPATYVPLDIYLHVCAHPDFWPEHLRRALELEFSDGYTADGRTGFFHPDNWTFGQALHASQLIGRALIVPGVGRVLLASIKRLHGLSGPSLSTVTLAPGAVLHPVIEQLLVRPFEIVQVANDPSHLETGRLNFEITGGRR